MLPENIEMALTFDDLLLLPSASKVLPSEVSLKTRLTREISLNTPLISAAMDTVTESAAAITMAREGGLGVVHKNMTIDQQVLEVERVKIGIRHDHRSDHRYPGSIGGGGAGDHGPLQDLRSAGAA